MIVEIFGIPSRDMFSIDYSDITTATVMSAGPKDELDGALGIEFNADLTPDQVIQVQDRALTTANEDTIRRRMQQAIASNNTFLGIASPTNQQVVTQVQRLTKECTALIKLMLDQSSDTTGT